MGEIFSKNVLNIENPRVGVLNIGEEAGKGNELVQNVYKMLDENTDGINFIGNIEGKELFHGDCDIVVCEGFVGNVALKVLEGTGSFLFKLIKEQFTSSLLGGVVGLMAKVFLNKIYPKVNYEEYGKF